MQYRRLNAPCVLAFLCVLVPSSALAERFIFAWPVPVSVGVEAEVERRDVRSRARYVVDLRAAEDGELALDFRDFEFLSLNGEDARDPRVAAAIAPLAAVTGALPTMRLSAAGEYLGTRGLNLVVQRIEQLLPADMDTQQRQQISRGLRSPQMQSMMAQRSGDTWNTWVGAWNGLDIEPGGTLSAKAPLEVMGRAIEQEVLFEHLGADQTYPGHVRLRMTALIEGPEIIALIGGIAEQFGAGDDGAGGLRSAMSRTVTEIVTHPHHLRLRYAEISNEVVVRESNGKAHRRQERKTYRFDWHEH